MSTSTFDTLAAARRLEEAGLSSAHAEAVVETVRDAVVRGVATKSDLAELRDQLTWRMVLVVGGFCIGGAGLVVAVLFRLLG